MRPTRRALLSTPFAGAALAQGDWRPERPLTMIVAFAAGGGTDAAARAIARFMEKDLGQSVVVLNRPGAGGEIGFAELARARPDGLTIGFINTPHIVTLPIERRTRFRLEDFALVGNIVDDPGGLWVRADSPFRDLAGLLAAARAEPDRIGYGTTGVGSDDHLAMLAIERAAGVRFLHVPFGGSAQVKQNLVSRAIPVAVMNVAEGVPEQRQGLLRCLGQMGAARWAPLAEVPTLREQGFDVVEGSMRGIAAPAGLPPEVLARLALSVRRTVEDGDFQAVAAQQNLPLRFLAPDAYQAELLALRAGYQALWDRHPWRDG